jgi:tetratricopeptide (TPR) repeat protein
MPEFGTAWVERAETYRQMGEYEKALEDLNHSKALLGEDAWMYSVLGEVQRGLKQTDQALISFHRALELDPVYDWALAHRGRLYRELQHYEKSLEDFNSAIQIKPNYVWAFYQRGELYQEMGNHDAAWEDYKKTLLLNPKYYWAKAGCAEILIYKQKYIEAIPYLEAFLQIRPEDAWGLGQLGYAYEKIGQTDLAILNYWQALAFDPENAWARQRWETLQNQKV